MPAPSSRLLARPTSQLKSSRSAGALPLRPQAPRSQSRGGYGSAYLLSLDQIAMGDSFFRRIVRSAGRPQGRISIRIYRRTSPLPLTSVCAVQMGSVGLCRGARVHGSRRREVSEEGSCRLYLSYGGIDLHTSMGLTLPRTAMRSDGAIR